MTMADGCCAQTLTSPNGCNWLSVDLQQITNVKAVTLVNRGDGSK